MAEAKKGAAKKASTPRAPRNTKKYIRNLYWVPLNIAISKEERFVLAPRGQRGDMRELTKEDEGNTRIVNNIGLTLELIGGAEAKAILDAQFTNQQAAVNPAMSILRDQLGREYEQTDVHIEMAPEQQGETVAPLVDGNVQIGKDGTGIQRERSVMPRVADVPGSDVEMRELLARDEAAKNGTDLASVLGHMTNDV